MTFDIGDFVILQGLESAKHYNGITAIVTGDKGDEGRYPVQLIDHDEDWDEFKSFSRSGKHECGGKLLNAKAANLLPSQDSKHWKIQVCLNQSIYEIITQSPMGDLEDCDKFCKALWGYLLDIAPAARLTKHMQNEICRATGHKLFWLGCEAIMHHMLIEKCRGRYRVFQAYVEGYTAKEWCRLRNSNCRLGNENIVWKKYGGGKTVGSDEIQILLDSIRKLQELIPPLTPHLLKNVPGISDQDVRDLRAIQNGNYNDGTQNLAQKVADICLSWSNDIMYAMGPLGLTTLGVNEFQGRIVYLNDSPNAIITVTQGPRTIFKIPIGLYKKVQIANYNLTGQVYLHPAIFVRMVQFGLLWEITMYSSTEGVTSFGLRGADVDDISKIGMRLEEQGIRLESK